MKIISILQEYGWIDDTPLNFVNWGYLQPNTHDGEHIDFVLVIKKKLICFRKRTMHCI